MSFSRPTAFSDGPCFTLAKNWTDAQRICESHGSNLATITDAMANDQYGRRPRRAAAPAAAAPAAAAAGVGLQPGRVRRRRRRCRSG